MWQHRNDVLSDEGLEQAAGFPRPKHLVGPDDAGQFEDVRKIIRLKGDCTSPFRKSMSF